VLKVANLVKTFPGGNGPVTVIDRVSFAIPEGLCFALLGPSGCGKTTTLRCVAGLETASSGRIEIGCHGIDRFPQCRPGQPAAAVAQTERFRPRRRVPVQQHVQALVAPNSFGTIAPRRRRVVQCQKGIGHGPGVRACPIEPIT